MPTNPEYLKPAQVYNTEKAAHLFRVFITVMSVSLLLCWQQIMLIQPLIEGKKAMAHLDPSEIIATPFPLHNVASFTMLTVTTMIIFSLVRSPPQFVASLASLTKASLATFALFALCGDNLIKHWKHSLLTAIYIGTLANSTSTGKKTSNILEEYPFNDFSDIISTYRLYGIIFFSIPFQIVSVLDHGNQNQRWPLPMLFGSTYGYVVGTIIALMMLSLQGYRKKSKTN